ncbi:MAG: sensor histidine kinase [Actinomycetia bacterium]|nr:sensor histidine kinase [Actinomycetes bacterium]
MKLLTTTATLVAVVCSAIAVLLAVYGPVRPLWVLFAATSVIFLPVTLVGSAVVRTGPRNPVGWILLVAGVCLPLSMAALIGAGIRYAHGGDPALLDLVTLFSATLSVPLIATFGILLFPDGRLGSRRRRLLAVACSVEMAVVTMWIFSPKLLDFPKVDNPLALGSFADGGVFGILLMGPVCLLTSTALLRRARAEGSPALRLAAYAGYVIAASYLACVVTGVSGGDTLQITVVENCAALTLGVAAWVGIVRYGLFDLRRVVNRALLYGTLTVAVLVVYLVLVVSLQGLLPQTIATVGAALAVLPLRDVLQRKVNQLVYGLRDEPAAVLGRLGERLDAAAAPDDMLPAAARTVADTLKLPYVSITVGSTVMAACGVPGSGRRVSLPLLYGGESLGALELETRDPGEEFGTAERSLVERVAQQVAVAARAVALTHALQASRERLVGAREEERRRLRRDLHDGLGATLTGIALGIDTAVRAQPGSSDLLLRLRAETENVISEIRRIVYDLRPAVLDELGLAEALRSHAANLGHVSVDAPLELPVLPAAVEVAAYRIAVEAMTNATRHAPGALIRLELSVDRALELRVTDSGDGIPDGFRAGVGITSMRQRASEVGGSCSIGRVSATGTLVHAVLPLEEVG